MVAVPLLHAHSARPTLIGPSRSLDDREIVVASGWDLWTVSAAGGDARLFVSHPATVSRPLRSPDGTRLAFVSTRSGTGDIYILTLASGALQRLTVDDIPDTLGACSCDGRLVWFHPPSRDIAVLTGGAREVVLSADGKQVAFVARGVSV